MKEMEVLRNWHLIVGAAGGIGQEIARILSIEGHIAIGVDAHEQSVPELAEHIIASLPESGFHWLSDLIKRRGLPCGVAFAHGFYQRWSLEDYDRNKYEQVLSSNFDSTFWLLKELVPRLAKARGGRIVVIGSQAAATGGLDPVYAASKAASVALVKSIAREYARYGILVNIVAPGPIETPMAFNAMPVGRIQYYRETIPIGRFVTPAEVAETVVFLLTSKQGGINGATIDIDGGLVRR